MAQFNDTGTKAFPVSGAIGRYVRVKLSSGSLAVAAVGDRGIGVIRDPAFAAGEVHTVLLYTKPGTLPFVASKSIAANVAIYSTASGQVTDTSAATCFLLGTNLLTAAANAGDIIEALPLSISNGANT